jgi:hypothetical protein
MICCLLD